MEVAAKKKAGRPGTKGIQVFAYPPPLDHAELQAYAMKHKRTIGNALLFLAMEKLREIREKEGE